MNKRKLFPKSSNSFRQFLAAATRPLRLLGLAVVMLGLLGSTMALHAAGNSNGTTPSLVGTWIIEVSFGGADCSLGDIVLYSCDYGLITFHADGTMAEVDTFAVRCQAELGTGRVAANRFKYIQHDV